MLGLIPDRIAVLYLGRVVEIGSADEITFNPKHPYTVALRNAAPLIGANVNRGELPALQGEVPSAARIPTGCRFHPRCPLAVDRWRQEEPPAVEVGPKHIAACWMAVDLPVPRNVASPGK
ncbi:ABC transporter ATP-binding protein [Mesorhizobium sp. M0045]|uniref:ABC transporter ATP-binding protein n=1 Tax=Mesorhizobium sp. M0045 TaxID=2956857 RepID=UPI00333B11F3